VKRFFARWVFGRSDGMKVPLLSWPLALLAVVALHVVSVLALTELTFNNSPEIYYPDDAPAVQLRDRLRQDFPGDEVLTVIFRGDDLYGRDFMQRLARATDALRRSPLIDRVSTVTTMERISGSSDGFAVERLVDTGALRNATPEQLKQRVLGDRFAPRALASVDGKHLAMVVRPKALTESSQRLQVSLAVAKAINEAGLRDHYAGEAGPVTMDILQLESILSDTLRFVPLTVLIALALLAWVVGRWRPVLVGAFAMSTVVLPTLAAIAASGRPYTMASAILPSLLAAYTVVTLLHLYAGIQRAQRHAQRGQDAVDEAVHETLKPGVFNVLTTTAGLLSLLLVPIPPIQMFGVAGALGTVVVFITVYGLVPPILRRWPGPAWPQRGTGLGSLGRVARRITSLSMRYPKTIVVASIALVVGFVPYALKVEVETDMLAFFAPEHRLNVHTRLIEAAFVGTTSLEVSLHSGERDAFQRVQTLREVKALQQWLETLPEVDRAGSMVELVEEMHWAMNRERPAFRTLPPNDRLLRQYLLVYDGDDLYELVNRDFQHSRIVLNLNVHGTQAIRGVIDKIRAHVEARPLPGIEIDVGGYGRLLADQVDLLVSGQSKSFAGAFAQIFLIMALLWRSPKGAALCMVPNLAPLFFIFVVMGALAIRLDSATVMIASVVLGITVDDTIHLFHGFRRRLRAGVDPVFAIARSFEATGRAVMATSAVLIGQFALLTMSDFVPTANFGLMTATGLAAGLSFELILLPALLLLFYGRKPTPRRRRITDRRAERRSSAPDRRRGRTTAPGARPPASAPAPPALLRHVLVCHGDRCKDEGAATVWRRLRSEELALQRRNGGLQLRLTKASCLGPCHKAPVVQVYPENLLYGPLTPTNLDAVVDEHLHQGKPVTRLALAAEVGGER
jgi:predicted RND superfamily exporter protein/(2Fe-2S) ferredoxin